MKITNAFKNIKNTFVKSLQNDFQNQKTMYYVIITTHQFDVTVQNRNYSKCGVGGASNVKGIVS
jgi:hypothetical protein